MLNWKISKRCLIFFTILLFLLLLTNFWRGGGAVLIIMDRATLHLPGSADSLPGSCLPEAGLFFPARPLRFLSNRGEAIAGDTTHEAVFKRPISPTAHHKRPAPLPSKNQVRAYYPRLPPQVVYILSFGQAGGMTKLIGLKRAKRTTVPAVAVAVEEGLQPTDKKVVYVYSREATVAAGSSRVRSELCRN
jgi:hypothetical protein